MQMETMLSEQVARYLDLASSQAKLTAANMANVDTPGYKALGMDFEAEMRAAMAGVEGGSAPQPVRVGLDGSFGAQLFKLNGESTLRPQGSLGVVVLFGMSR